MSQKNTKNYLIDTSVILDDPHNVITLFQEGLNHLYITNIVLLELDGHKEDGINQKGVFAREFIRALDQGTLTEQENNKIKSKKIVGSNDYHHVFNCLFEGQTNPVQITAINRSEYKKENYSNDLKLVEVAKDYELELITNDANLKLISLSQGVKSSSLRKDSVNNPESIDFKIEEKTTMENKKEKIKELEKLAKNYGQIILTIVDENGYETGVKEFYLAEPTNEMKLTKAEISEADFEKLQNLKKEIKATESTKKEALENAKTTVSSKTMISVSIITEDGKETGNREFYLVESLGTVKLVPLKMDDEDFKDYKVKPINLEQKFLLRMLSHKKNKITVCTGSTGSGKTLMVLQEALRRVEDKDDPIEKIIYLRNTVTANDKASELGFRKGDQNQKLGYFAYPLFGNINFILENTTTSKKFTMKNNKDDDNDKSKNSISKEDQTEEFMKKYNIEVIDIAHARGITLSNCFVIFDEVQNASNATAQLIGTRMGNNSVLVLLGDYRQVDHPYLSKQRNALVSMLKKGASEEGFDSNFISAIQLRKTIRSEIANWFQNF